MRRVVVIAVLCGVGFASAARASTYTVGTTADPPGACAGTEDCSLRQLIAKVHASPFPPDTIVVPAGTYMLSAGLGALEIEDSMSIVGAGADTTTIAQPVPADRSVSGDRVFDILAGPPTPAVSISGVTVTGGTAQPGNDYFGGNVQNAGTLTLNEVWVTGGSAYSGGGIANRGGTLTVQRSLISGNHAPYGGGDSGAILNYGSSGPPARPGHLVIDDSTVTGNDARQVGGVLSWTEGDVPNTLIVRSSTIAANVTKDQQFPAVISGGGLGISEGTGVIENSIVAGNLLISSGVTTQANCGPLAGGPLVSLGHNLDSGADCQLTGPGDLSSTDPLLGPLAANGGPTMTLGLAAGSPALDQIPASGADCAATDQRGVARPEGPACDIGAFELAAVPPVVDQMPVNAPGAPGPPAVGPPAPPGPGGAAPPRRLNLPANGIWAFSRGQLTRVVALSVKNVPAGTTVTLQCKSSKRAGKKSRCPFTTRTVKVKKATKRLELAKYFDRRRLANGTTFTVQVTQPSAIGTVTRFTTRNRKSPRRQVLCLRPGAKRASAC